MSLKKGTEMVSVRNAQSEMKECEVGDATGSIHLKVWDSQIVSIKDGSSYRFTNLSTREYLGSILLTTTRATVIQPIAAISGVAPKLDGEGSEVETLSTFRSTVEGAHIEAKRQCPKCHTQQLSFDSKVPFHRCEKCKILRKGASYVSKLSGEIVFVSEKGELSLSIPNSVLRSYLDGEGCFRDMLDVQDIEEHLITGDCFEVVHNRANLMISLKKVVQDVSVGGSEVSDVDLLKVGLTDDSE